MRTLDELKLKYMAAVIGQTNTETMRANVRKGYNAVKDQLKQNLKSARQGVNRISRIAARANPLSEADYIDLLIESEQLEKKSEWNSRMKYLQELREIDEIKTAIA
jgi:hypothetical protein